MKDIILKWKCLKCKDIVISKASEHHKMDFCKCGNIGVDLEFDYTRVATNNPDDYEVINKKVIK